MVVGIPNVGKSTFINSFAGKAAAKTGNKAKLKAAFLPKEPTSMCRVGPHSAASACVSGCK